MRSKEPAKLKIVLDTSVCVAALLSETGGSAKVLEAVFTGKIYNFYTDEILDEINEVLQRKKFSLEREKWEHFLHLFAESSFLVKSLKEFEVSKCRDPKDDMVLTAAIAAKAEIIISGDKDLIALTPFRNIEIIPPSAFLERLYWHDKS